MMDAFDFGWSLLCPHSVRKMRQYTLYATICTFRKIYLVDGNVKPASLVVLLGDLIEKNRSSFLWRKRKLPQAATNHGTYRGGPCAAPRLDRTDVKILRNKYKYYK